MEQKLSKFEERKRTLEEEVGTRKTQIIENEMSKQQHENEIRRLEAEIKEKTETLNSVIGKEVNTDTNTVAHSLIVLQNVLQKDVNMVINTFILV